MTPGRAPHYGTAKDYGPSTPATQAAATKEMARRVAQQRYRKRISTQARGINIVGNNVYDRDLLIGTTTAEDAPISRVTPRRLGNPRLR